MTASGWTTSNSSADRPDVSFRVSECTARTQMPGRSLVNFAQKWRQKNSPFQGQRFTDWRGLDVCRPATNPDWKGRCPGQRRARTPSVTLQIVKVRAEAIFWPIHLASSAPYHHPLLSPASGQIWINVCEEFTRPVGRCHYLCGFDRGGIRDSTMHVSILNLAVSIKLTCSAFEGVAATC